MLVLRTSNFQGANITQIVPRQTLYCFYCSPLKFSPHTSSKITLNYFLLFFKKTDNIDKIFYKPASLQKNFQGATIRPIVPRQKHSIVFIVHH